ncbi:TniQ family protein [Curtobacterium sp. BH-2-1-1]|uniref:TniQ family protein n=1 Tax=Curtobacterium sp. BH-2-1-1 TaxID=1905847 RepID=UPI0009F3870E|nr:TniQ family protein [Curtobacterium sp. BH-2-1-1]
MAEFHERAARFPGRPLPIPGESIHSWLRRYAWMFRSSHAELLNAMDLTASERRKNAQWRGRIPDSVSEKLESHTGVHRDVLHAMTLQRFHRRFVEVRADGAVARKHWARGSGTRYCPSCLNEHDGAFQNDWQLASTFLCIRHNTLLVDGCQDCHLEQYVLPPGAAALNPMHCASRRVGEGPCGSYLPAHFAEPVLASSPLVTAQQFINDLASSADASEARAALLNLEGVMHGIRKGASIEAIAEHADLDPGELRGLQPESSRAQRPSSALDYGALAAWAVPLVTASESDVRADYRRLVLHYDWAALDEHSTTGFGSPEHLTARWSPQLLPQTRTRLLRAVDTHLTLMQRLQHATTVDAPTRAAQPMIAPAMWPAWAVALDTGGSYTESAFRTAMSAALALVGTREEHPGAKVKYRPFKEAVRPELFDDDHLTDQLRLLTQLAIRLQPAAAEAINYPERANAIFRTPLLPDHAWKRIANHLRIPPGGATRALMARRYAYNRMTGSTGSAYPEKWSRQRADDSNLYSNFCLSMTSELQAAIDQYLRSYLRQLRIGGPVTSTPAVDLLNGAVPGRALRDIDLSKLHALLDGGERRIGVLTSELQRTEIHVRAAVDTFPLSSATVFNAGPLDWPSLPARRRARASAA